MNLNNLRSAALNVREWFETNFSKETGLNHNDDIAIYFKVPSMLLAGDSEEKANEVQQFIMKNFLMNTGDFKKAENCKTENPTYIEYYSYMNCWIMRSGLKLKIDMTNSFDYIHNNFNNYELKDVSASDNCIELLTVANIGYTYLIKGDLQEAIRAANCLEHFWNIQQEKDKYFYLRMDKHQKLIKSNPENPFYCISKTNDNQLYFFLGFPISFLAELYDLTKDKKYLNLSKSYYNYTINCHGIFKSNFSHKVSWAASILYRITGDNIYLDAIEKITNHILENRDKTGLWLTNDGSIDYDQTAEFANWFFEIIKNIEKRVDIK
ncbi:unnamed protein product [Dimorphilus gyrociliatus]|uniref:Uncharacterized protein n=1 Tax=Dimorphilus gyrociliatus TaxID=2664684 RepID=A0A7I8V5Z6_9ANNE|nr:unnamed protein product [Dimorphilus gyrociliatus]